jgi:hypothetical protein
MALVFRDATPPRQLAAVLSPQTTPTVPELRDGASDVMDKAISTLVGMHTSILTKGGLVAAPAADVTRYGKALEITVLFLRDMVRSAPAQAIVVRFPKALWDDVITIGGDRMVVGFDHNAVADALIEMRNAEALCVGVEGESYTSPDAWCQQSWYDGITLEPTFYHYVYRAVAYLFWTITDAVKARIAAFLEALAALGVKITGKTDDLWNAYKDYLVIAAVVLGIGATLYLLPQIKAALSPLTYKP